MHGRVVHFEIPADDLPRAEGFYRDALGWGINSIPGMGYTLVSTTPSTAYFADTEGNVVGLWQTSG